MSKSIMKDIIFDGPITDPRAFGAVGDGDHDDTAAFQAMFDERGSRDRIFIPNMRFKITDRIDCQGAFDVKSLGIIEAYGDAGFDFSPAPDQAPNNISQDLYIDGLRIIYMDTPGSHSVDRIGIKLTNMSYNTVIERCSVVSMYYDQKLESVVTAGPFHIGLDLQQCFGVAVRNCVFRRGDYGILTDLVSGNRGNYIFDSNAFLQLWFPFAVPDRAGLNDSTTFINNMINWPQVGGAGGYTYNYVQSHIKSGLAANITKTDTIVSVYDASVFAGVTPPFPIFTTNGVQGMVTAIHEDTDVLDLQWPAKGSINLAGTVESQVVAGSVGIMMDTWSTNYKIQTNHFEGHDYYIFGGTYLPQASPYRSSGIIEGNIFNSNVVNPIYLNGIGHLDIHNNMYTRMTGDYHFVRLGNPGGLNKYYDDLMIEAPIKSRASAYFDDQADYAYIYVYDDPAMTYQPAIKYKYKIGGIDLRRGFTAAPTAGSWLKGQIVLNDNPTPGGYVGWICTTAGSPGTWKGWGVIAS